MRVCVVMSSEYPTKLLIGWDSQHGNAVIRRHMREDMFLCETLERLEAVSMAQHVY